MSGGARRAGGAWLGLVALALVAGCGAAPPPPPRELALNQPGALVDVEATLVPGWVTLVDFRADWCGACKVFEARFRAALADEPGVLIRIVDVGDGDTPVARRYQIGALPHIRIYDRHRRLRYVLAGNDGLDAGALAAGLAAER